MNELEKAYKRHSKKQKGLSPFVKLNAGNVEQNIDIINHMAGADTSTAGEATATAGVGEGLKRTPLEEELDQNNVHTISELFDYMEKRKR